MKITLSLWDIGGQERFEFFKSDFFRGTAAVGLVFDLSRPETFKEIGVYVESVMEHAGNIPIILVGNKVDLKEDIGEAIPREKIIKKVIKHNIIKYIETSVMQNIHVEKLFKTLAFVALFDLLPRLGELPNSNHCRFKVLLLGPASVGKSSLIKTIVNKRIDDDYKITIGLDLVKQDFEIPNEDIISEVSEIIKIALPKSKRKLKTQRKKEKVLTNETEI